MEYETKGHSFDFPVYISILHIAHVLMKNLIMHVNVLLPGVHNVDVEREKGEIKVKGNFDAIKIQKRLEKLCKKKVELVSPKVQIKESTTTEKIVVKETKTKEVSGAHSLPFSSNIYFFIDLTSDFDSLFLGIT